MKRVAVLARRIEPEDMRCKAAAAMRAAVVAWWFGKRVEGSV